MEGDHSPPLGKTVDLQETDLCHPLRGLSGVRWTEDPSEFGEEPGDPVYFEHWVTGRSSLLGIGVPSWNRTESEIVVGSFSQQLTASCSSQKEAVNGECCFPGKSLALCAFLPLPNE